MIYIILNVYMVDNPCSPISVDSVDSVIDIEGLLLSVAPQLDVC